MNCSGVGLVVDIILARLPIGMFVGPLPAPASLAFNIRKGKIIEAHHVGEYTN